MYGPILILMSRGQLFFVLSNDFFFPFRSRPDLHPTCWAKRLKVNLAILKIILISKGL